jgi:two-component system nitrogen regulation sensor histidine kinase GlnL
MQAMKMQSPEELKRIIENLNTIVLLFDHELRLKFINPVGEMLFGVSAPRLEGQQAEALLNSHYLAYELQKALDSGHPFTERECEIGVAANEQVTVDLTSIPLLEPGKPRELLVEMNQIDRQIRIAKEEQLLAQNRVSRDLLRGIAHEIKNPLGGLRGTAQLLERELQDESLKDYTGIIISEADRLRNLVDRMLGPRSLPKMEEVNIHEVLERVRSVMLGEISSGIRIRRDYDPSIPLIKADKDQLIQVILNLVRNAANAIGKEGEIRLRSRVQRQYTIGHRRYRLVASIEIIDNGSGIPPELVEKIFYPMVTGSAEGTGLGLSIAQSIINQHNGLIECSSEPGNTVFTVLIPLVAAAGDEDE